MVKTKVGIVCLIIAAALFCSLAADAQQWSRIPVVPPADSLLSGTALRESRLLERCRPAMDSLYRTVGYAPKEILGYRPSSPLGNFVTDALLDRARKLCDAECQLAIVNYGGVRIDMPRGEIRVDDIKSIFPFKDSICIVKTSGANVLALFNRMASGKWEFFSGAQIVADSLRVLKMSVDGEPLDADRIYTLVCCDFLLNGGDGYFIAKGAQSVRKTAFKTYDLLLSYLSELRDRGESITAATDDRLVLENVKKPPVPLPVAVCPTSPSGAKPRLTILHTNDIHSHLEPVRGGKYGGMAGVCGRAVLIDSIRKADGRRNVLLLDAGDFCQGTSYFPVFGGRVEVEAMNIMGYDVTTLGNHEWDYGVDALERNLRRARFKTVLCNYTVADARLARRLSPYVIVRRGGMKIGIIGALTDISTKVKGGGGLGIEFVNPVEPVNKWAAFLKNEKSCDLVILLSHCGFDDGTPGNPSDSDMAPLLRNVDIIIGGHTHTDLREPVRFNDASGRDIMVVTDFKWGIYLGEIKIIR